MRPIVNMSEQDRAMYTATGTKNLVKIVRVVLEVDRQTDIFITILRNPSCGQSNEK